MHLVLRKVFIDTKTLLKYNIVKTKNVSSAVTDCFDRYLNVRKPQYFLEAALIFAYQVSEIMGYRRTVVVHNIL